MCEKIKNSDLLKDFFSKAESLKHNNIIKSDRFLGDIGEFIIEKKYGLIPPKNKREKYIDGTIGSETVQVKFSSSPTNTNINIGNPTKYDILYLILSKQSMHFPLNETSQFIVYRILSQDILKDRLVTLKGKYYYTRNQLTKYSYDKVSFEDLD
jgi:hypothetical protein